MRVRFEVEGLPPKKDGANSMWHKPTEQTRLLALRIAAKHAMGGQAPFRSPVALTIRLHALPSDGDLDNFITGICDGLMAAAQNTPACEFWAARPDVDPSKRIALEDDRLVQRIAAERLSPGAAGRRYFVELEDYAA